MEELKKILMRSFRKIEYTNTDMIPGYERTESEYKKLRDSLSLVEQTIMSMQNYEHGSKIFKSIKSGLQFLNDKASMNMYKSMDIYEEAALSGSSLKEASGSSEMKSTADKFSNAFNGISKSKKSFNAKLLSMRNKLKEFKEKAGEVDRLRKKVRNMRFDLEVLLQDGGYNDEIRDTEKKEFNEYSKTAMKAMSEFIDSSNISDILKDLSTEYKKHMEESADILKNVR